MDFWGTVLVLARRWYVSVPALVLTIAGVLGVYVLTPAHYESHAVAVVTPPLTGGTEYPKGYVPGTTNPLMNFNNGLSVTGSLLIQSMGTADFAARVRMPTDGATTFEVNNGSENPESLTNAPFVFVRVVSTAPELPQELVSRVLDAARDDLAREQDQLRAPVVTHTELTTIVPPSSPLPQQGNRLRGVAAALGLGLIMSLAGTFAAESILQARRRRTSRRSPAAPAPEPGTATAEPNAADPSHESTVTKPDRDSEPRTREPVAVSGGETP